jgi:RNA polymerase sigma-70 factor (ECF subfamily)
MPHDHETLSRQFMDMRHSLFAYIRPSVESHQDAEDIFQDVWVSVLKAAERGQEIEDVYAWCLAVARNLVNEHWRKASRKTKSLLVDDEMLDILHGVFAGGTKDESLWKEKVPALRVCLARMAASSRQAVQCRYFEGLSMDEMSRRLKKSKESLYMVLSRSRVWLKECMERSVRAGETES